MHPPGAGITEEIRQRVDLLEVVSAHVALKRAGRQYKGLCPFHVEKTPSFHVDPERGLWYCFGCHLGGTVFDFVMRVEGLTFPEALEALAARAGVALPRPAEEREALSEREAMLRALDAAAGFFRAELEGVRGRVARAYLAQRGVDDETARRFGLGYAPAAWDALLGALRARGFAVELLERVGLVQPREGGPGRGHYDMFRHRLIFPIHDLQGRVVGFGGRALDDAVPKYLNSRESPAFNKGRLLYGLPQAREAIREVGEAVVVEGYMDVLACHQFGVRNAVATLGTALTVDHVRLLRRVAPRVVLVYDADAPGLAATERGLGLFEEAEVAARVAVLPEGDPDAFLRRAGAAEFRTLVDQALPMFEFRLEQALGRHDTHTVEGRVALADEMLVVIASVANPVRQSEYVRMVAERAGLAEAALRQRLAAGPRRGASGRQAPPPVLEPASGRERAEHDLVWLMVHDLQARAAVRRHLQAADFAHPRYAKLARVLLESDEAAEILCDRVDAEVVADLTRLLFRPVDLAEKVKERVLTDCVRLLQAERLRAAQDRVTRELAAAERAGDVGRLRQLQAEVLRLQLAVRRLRAGAAEGAPRKGGDGDGEAEGTGADRDH